MKPIKDIELAEIFYQKDRARWHTLNQIFKRLEYFSTDELRAEIRRVLEI